MRSKIVEHEKPEKGREERRQNLAKETRTKSCTFRELEVRGRNFSSYCCDSIKLYFQRIRGKGGHPLCKVEVENYPPRTEEGASRPSLVKDEC